jgi:epoxyqueuosine reductase
MAPTSANALKRKIERYAREQGFRGFGIARVARPRRFDLFDTWLSEGRHAAMGYLERSKALREHPESLLPGAKSIVVLSYPYPAGDPGAPDGARTARYALSPDYHTTLRARCEAVLDLVRREDDRTFKSRICVDSAPILERDFAAAAGIGWIGKNGMVMNESDGSYFFLCEILLDIELPEDSPVAERCGSCVACLDACPTQAFSSPGVVDAKRCISYWTIEQRGVIPPEISKKLSGWVFGCDICQEACPYNHGIARNDLARRPPELSELLAMRASRWRREFRDTPLSRAGNAGLKRNAAALAESSGRSDLLPQLAETARDAHPVVAAQARRAFEGLSRADFSRE